jgi:hypothetical protein
MGASFGAFAAVDSGELGGLPIGLLAHESHVVETGRHCYSMAERGWRWVEFDCA